MTSLLTTVARGTGAALVVAGAALAALMLIPAAFGLQRYVITGGSMSGTYDRGAIVYEREVPTSAIGVGDVITYTPPAGSGPGGLVTHRVVARRLTADRGLVFRTKGDNNAAVDPWQFVLTQPTQPKVVFAVPLAGYAFAALAVREIRLAVIAVPALLIALLSLVRMWREAGRLQQARRPPVGAPVP